MKICFVVLAHHQPKVFSRLIRNICWEGSDVVVHIDKRADLGEFDMPRLPNVHFMRRRHRVNRSGWSLTRTIVAALEYALTVSDANYFMYLAGTDFPIRPRNDLLNFLGEQYPANLLNYYPLVPGIWGYGLIDKYWLNDLASCFLDLRRIDVRPKGIKGLLAELVLALQRKLNTRFSPRDTSILKFYSGSSRWCINRKTVEFVVDYFRSAESRSLRRYLQTCANSDEIFFQTAILNSTHKTECVGFDEIEAMEIFAGTRAPMPDEKRVYLHYIDWSPEREDPAILTESDLPGLQKSGKYFACKLTDDKSLGLADMLIRLASRGTRQ